jgi:thymidylate synthase
MGEEQGYLDLIKRILETGEERTGRNGTTYALYGERLEFNLSTGFPLLSTKRVFWRGVAEELFWFLRGSTDANELAAKNVHIWDDNTTPEFQASVGLSHLAPGQLGAGYGHQWRAFNGTYPSVPNTGKDCGVDQIRYVLEQLVTNPYGRRAILSAWNPCQLDQAVLPPCHVMYQFYVSKKHGLSCMMTQRSADVCAGVPFNIASTALLTSLMAHILHIPVHRVVVNMGDTHIYEDHVECAREQCQRTPYAKPTLRIVRPPPPKEASIDEKILWLETLSLDGDGQGPHVVIDNYQCHPPIKYKMIA